MYSSQDKGIKSEAEKGVGSEAFFGLFMPPGVNRATLQTWLEQYFGQIPDPRVERTRVHPLLVIIVIALFAVLSGAASWVAIETYGNAKRS